MPKTSFVDAVTAVSAAFLNKIFAHVHDGLDQDGSAPKVELTAHIDYGSNGRLEVTQDDGALHEITHTPDGALLSKFASNVLSGGIILFKGAGGEVTSTYQAASAPAPAGVHFDAGVFADDAITSVTYVLGTTGLRLKASQNQEADGDVEFLADNVIAAVGRVTLTRKAAHSTITDVGLSVQALKLAYDNPGGASSGDFATTFPRDETLYKGNLAKLLGAFSLSWNASGVPSLDSAGGYNLANASLQAAGGSYAYAGIEVDVTDDFTPSTLLATPLYVPSSGAPIPVMVQATQLAGPTTRVRLTVLFDDAGTWKDALITQTALQNSELDLSLVAY